MQLQPLPFEEKMHAIAYINSNCGAQSGRSEIMRNLIALQDKAKVSSLCYCQMLVGQPESLPLYLQSDGPRTAGFGTHGYNAPSSFFPSGTIASTWGVGQACTDMFIQCLAVVNTSTLENG